MEKYNKKIAGNPEVALIHLSMEKKEGLLKWAQKENFTWPTVLQSDFKEAGIDTAKLAVRGVPSYIVIGNDGTIDPDGKSAALRLLYNRDSKNSEE